MSTLTKQQYDLALAMFGKEWCDRNLFDKLPIKTSEYKPKKQKRLTANQWARKLGLTKKVGTAIKATKPVNPSAAIKRFWKSAISAEIKPKASPVAWSAKFWANRDIKGNPHEARRLKQLGVWHSFFE